MIQIWIGTSPNGEDAEANAVLEYSLRSRSSEPLDIHWLKLSKDRNALTGGWNTKYFKTPFTPLRWIIPQVCDGKAIYMDTDIIVLGDIAELWHQPMNGNAILVSNPERSPKKPTPRSCVMMIDCDLLRQKLPSLSKLKASTDANVLAMRALDGFVGKFTGKWNCTDLKGSSLEDPDLKAVHYSSIAHQLHLGHATKRLRRQGRNHWYDGERFPHWRIELIELFDQMLDDAIDAGYPLRRYDPGRIEVPFQMVSYKNKRVKGFS